MSKRKRFVGMVPSGERKGWLKGSFMQFEFEIRRLKLCGKRVYRVVIWENGRLLEYKDFKYLVYARDYIDNYCKVG